MSRDRGTLRWTWVVVALVAGLIAAPVGAVAATQLVRIVGPSGKAAQVDPANRLLVAESSPAAFVDTGFQALTGGAGCRTLLTAPATRGVIVTQLNVKVKTSSAFDASHGFVIASQPACGGGFVFEDQPSQLGSQVFTLVPGRPIPAGGVLTAEAIGAGFSAEVQITGYKVPKGAVP